MGHETVAVLALGLAASAGLVLSSISSRTGTRTCATRVQGGASPSELSPEEQEAITEAVRPRRPARQPSGQRS